MPQSCRATAPLTAVPASPLPAQQARRALLALLARVAPSVRDLRIRYQIDASAGLALEALLAPLAPHVQVSRWAAVFGHAGSAGVWAELHCATGWTQRINGGGLLPLPRFTALLRSGWRWRMACACRCCARWAAAGARCRRCCW